VLAIFNPHDAGYEIFVRCDLASARDLRHAPVVAGGRGEPERDGGEGAVRRVEIVGVRLGGEAGKNPLGIASSGSAAPVLAARRAAELGNEACAAPR
jgi:hypothetical protein